MPLDPGTAARPDTKWLHLKVIYFLPQKSNVRRSVLKQTGLCVYARVCVFVCVCVRVCGCVGVFCSPSLALPFIMLFSRLEQKQGGACYLFKIGAVARYKRQYGLQT